MKNISIHSLSAVLGGSVVVAFFLVMGMAQGTYTATPLGDRIRVEGIPAPDQLVRIREGQVYTVPDGRVLVLTGVVTQAEDPMGPDLTVRPCIYKCFVDGQGAFAGYLDPRPNSLAPGYLVGPGSTVEIDDKEDGSQMDPAATLLGYLSNI